MEIPMNIEQIRKDTLGVGYVTHFNNAGASLVTQQVLDETNRYLAEEAITGGYRYAKKKQLGSMIFILKRQG